MSVQHRQQRSHEAAAVGEAVDLDVFVECMRISAANAGAAERRIAHRAGEVAVVPAFGSTPGVNSLVTFMVSLTTRISSLETVVASPKAETAARLIGVRPKLS